MLKNALKLASSGLIALSLNGLAYGQAATVTQQYLGAPVPSPVVAVELDAAPSRALAGGTGGALGPGMPPASQPASTYGGRIQSQASPAMYTGVGSTGGPTGLGSGSATLDLQRR